MKSKTIKLLIEAAFADLALGLAFLFGLSWMLSSLGMADTTAGMIGFGVFLATLYGTPIRNAVQKGPRITFVLDICLGITFALLGMIAIQLPEFILGKPTGVPPESLALIMLKTFIYIAPAMALVAFTFAVLIPLRRRILKEATGSE